MLEWVPLYFQVMAELHTCNNDNTREKTHASILQLILQSWNFPSDQYINIALRNETRTSSNIAL